jgi:hypothetical protein
MEATTGIRYQRYMDDYVIFAPTRHKLRKAIKLMYAVLDDPCERGTSKETLYRNHKKEV